MVKTIVNSSYPKISWLQLQHPHGQLSWRIVQKPAQWPRRPNFAYDSFDRRTQNASGKAFLYDGANAVQELSGSTVTANLLTGGIDEIFTRTDSAGERDFLNDGLGSTIALTDSSGTTQTQYTFEPFGKTTGGGSSTANSFELASGEIPGTSETFMSEPIQRSHCPV